MYLFRGYNHSPYLCWTNRDWLFEKYDNDELIIIDSVDDDEEDDTLIEFMSSHLCRDGVFETAY